MSGSKSGVDRRELLRTGLTVAAGAAVARTGLAADARPPATARPGALPTRVLGGTGVVLPRLALGGVTLARWGQWAMPWESRLELVRHAYEAGIRYFDTAREYKEAERALGEALADVRGDVFLNSKVDVVKPEYVRRTVETSLAEFGTDHLDGVQIHGTPGVEAMTTEGALAVRDELLKLKEEGLVRFVGLTGHAYFDKVLALIQAGGFDTVMLANGYFRKGMIRLLSSELVELRELCVAAAHRRGMGILSMKVMAGSVLAPRQAARLVPELEPEAVAALPAAAIRWALQDDRVDLLCIGHGSPEEIDANIRTISSDTTFTEADREVLARFSARAYPAYAETLPQA